MKLNILWILFVTALCNQVHANCSIVTSNFQLLGYGLSLHMICACSRANVQTEAVIVGPRGEGEKSVVG
jgi:hypothetical protein